jgi:hypothetical protein
MKRAYLLSFGICAPLRAHHGCVFQHRLITRLMTQPEWRPFEPHVIDKFCMIFVHTGPIKFKSLKHGKAGMKPSLSYLKICMCIYIYVEHAASWLDYLIYAWFTLAYAYQPGVRAWCLLWISHSVLLGTRAVGRQVMELAQIFSNLDIREGFRSKVFCLLIVAGLESVPNEIHFSMYSRVVTGLIERRQWWTCSVCIGVCRSFWSTLILTKHSFLGGFGEKWLEEKW